MAPGLSIRMNASYISDVVGIDGVDGNALKAVRQEYSGAVSTHNTCDMASGAVITIRPGCFAAEDNPSAGGSVVDKSGDIGDTSSSKPKFIEIV